jgi:hypothetical protein
MAQKNYKSKMKRNSQKIITNPVFGSRFLSKKLNLFSVTFFIAILKSGIWVFPAIYASFVISQQPFQQPFSNPDDQYLMTTWFASYFAHIIGIKTLASFIILHFCFAIFSVIFLYRYVTKFVDKDIQGKSILLFAILPALSTIFYWVGMDSFTFMLMTIYLNLRLKPQLAVLVGLIGGLHHFEIIFVSAVSLFVYELVRGKAHGKSKEFIGSVMLLVGVLAGKILLTIVFELNQVVVSKNRVSIGINGLQSNFELIEKFGFLVYYSMLGSIWIILLIALFKRNRESIALLLAILIPVVVVLFVRDSSRVIQLTSFLPVAIGLLSNKGVLETISNKTIKIVALIWLIIPWVWIWQRSFGSVTIYTLKYIHSRVFNSDLAPWLGNISMWPFS